MKKINTKVTKIQNSSKDYSGMTFFIKVEISIHLWLACRRSDEVVDDLDGDRGCDIEVEDEMEAMEHIELLREPIEGEGVVGGVA